MSTKLTAPNVRAFPKTGELAESRSETVGRSPSFRLAAAAESLAVFAACQWLLWHHSGWRRQLWLAVLAYMVLSVWRHGYTLSHLGLRPLQGLKAMRWVALGAGAATVPVFFYGMRHGRVELILPDAAAILQFAGYAWWCLLQQFALQSFMHNRLADVVQNRHFNSVVLGIMFGSLHLPNTVLMVATFAGGIAMSEVFARYRNIYVLALAQALVSIALFVSFPDAWHHRLRVGSGFYGWPH